MGRRKILDAAHVILYLGCTENFGVVKFRNTNLRAQKSRKGSGMKRFVVITALAALFAVVVAAWPTVAAAYMPPPHPCEIQPMYYGPPPPPSCAPPPPPPICTPCPPMRCYPRQIVGPPPCPITVCKCPPIPSKAAYRVTPRCAVPPPPACPPPPCGPTACVPSY